jgi:hypothetical protein
VASENFFLCHPGDAQTLPLAVALIPEAGVQRSQPYTIKQRGRHRPFLLVPGKLQVIQVFPAGFAVSDY